MVFYNNYWLQQWKQVNPTLNLGVGEITGTMMWLDIVHCLLTPLFYLTWQPCHLQCQERTRKLQGSHCFELDALRVCLKAEFWCIYYDHTYVLDNISTLLRRWWWKCEAQIQIVFESPMWLFGIPWVLCFAILFNFFINKFNVKFGKLSFDSCPLNKEIKEVTFNKHRVLRLLLLFGGRLILANGVNTWAVKYFSLTIWMIKQLSCSILHIIENRLILANSAASANGLVG